MRGWIRVDVGTAEPMATLHVVVHRIPRTQRISLALASRLAARGMPVAVHR